MTWSRVLKTYVLLWLAVEIVRALGASTYLLWAHDLMLAAAWIGGPLVISLACEEAPAVNA